MKRYLIIFLAFLFVSGCDDGVAQLDDMGFQNFLPGEQTLVDTKSTFPKFSKEFVWHSKEADDNESDQGGALVTLVYHTRHGHYFLRFEDNILVHKRKLP